MLSELVFLMISDEGTVLLFFLPNLLGQGQVLILPFQTFTLEVDLKSYKNCCKLSLYPFI